PLLLDFKRRVVGQAGGRRAGARTENEAETEIEIDVLHEFDHGFEIRLGLAGKTDDEVRGNQDVWTHFAQATDDGLVFQRRIAAFHRHQDLVRAMLHRQVKMIYQLGDLGIGIDQTLREFLGMAGDEANAFDAVHYGNVFDQQGKVGNLAVGHHATVGIHILAQQRDFLYALVRETSNFGQHILETARDFLAARVGHYAIAAI